MHVQGEREAVVCVSSCYYQHDYLRDGQVGGLFAGPVRFPAGTVRAGVEGVALKELGDEGVM